MTMNVRGKMVPPVDKEYCGNVFAIVTATAAIEDIAECSLESNVKVCGLIYVDCPVLGGCHSISAIFDGHVPRGFVAGLKGQ